MKLRRSLALAALTAALLSNPLPSAAQSGGLFIPMGGGYSDVYAGFTEAAIANARGGVVRTLVLPMTYSTNPETISAAEREQNLKDAEERRFQIEEACKRMAPADLTCVAEVAPIFTRDDALSSDPSQFFGADLAAVFVLGGDQTVAMQVIADTPLEAALAEAHANGTIIAGTSAGASVQSTAMMGGYRRNFAAGNALDFGATEIWNSPTQRGLPFGLAAITDQHFFQRGRVGRLLNAIAQPEAPALGIGVDAYTGAIVRNQTQLGEVFGLYTVAVLDAETYHAAAGVQYVGAQNTLSLRNVLVHLLAPGEFSYDLRARQHSLGAAEAYVERDFTALRSPTGAGPLIVGGNLSEELADNPVLERFATLLSERSGTLVIVAAGFPSERSGQSSAERYAEALGLAAEIIVQAKDASAPVSLPSDLRGIVLIGRDQALLRPDTLLPLRDAWLSGTPLLADNAAAALIGTSYSAHEPTPEEGEEAEAAAQKSFLQGRTSIAAGLNLLPVQIEPRVQENNRWGRLFSLAYNAPQQLTLGLNSAGAVEFGAEGATVLGNAPLFVLDLRRAALDLGSNEGFVIANALLDLYAPSERVEPVIADVNAQYTPMPTPSLPPTPSPTAAPSATPTPAPSATPTTAIAPSATPASVAQAVPSPQVAATRAAPRPQAEQALGGGPDLRALYYGLAGGLIATVLLVGAFVFLAKRR